MSTPNPTAAAPAAQPNAALVAVAPEIIAMLQALVTFDNSMGTDPSKWLWNFAPAKLILDGTLLKQLQLMEPALAGVAITEVNGLWASLIAKVQAAKA